MRTPAFSSPQSVRGSEPVASTTQSTRTTLSSAPDLKMTRFAVPSFSRATTLASVITMMPSSVAKYSRRV